MVIRPSIKAWPNIIPAVELIPIQKSAIPIVVNIRLRKTATSGSNDDSLYQLQLPDKKVYR